MNTPAQAKTTTPEIAMTASISSAKVAVEKVVAVNAIANVTTTSSGWLKAGLIRIETAERLTLVE